MFEFVVSAIVLCNNTNWEYINSPCQAPPIEESMVINPFGVSYGKLESGKTWEQTRITKDIAIFRMDEVCQVVTVYGTWDCNQGDNDRL